MAKRKPLNRSKRKESQSEETINILDDDITPFYPKDPRLNAQIRKEATQKLSHKMLSLAKTTKLNEWCTDINQFIVNSSCFRPSQFGELLPHLAPKWPLLIPWYKMSEFRYNSDSNPCIDSGQANVDSIECAFVMNKWHNSS